MTTLTLKKPQDPAAVDAKQESRRKLKMRLRREDEDEKKMMRIGRQKWLLEHPNIATLRPPERPWGRSKEAARGAPWWGVKRLGPHGNAYHGRIFRHASEEGAKCEAQFLAELWPGTVFVVLAMVSVHVVGEPEVSLQKDGEAPIDASPSNPLESP